LDDVNEADRAHAGLICMVFVPSLRGGGNRKNRDSGGLRRAVASPFRALILVRISEWITAFSRRRIRVFRFGSCGRSGVKIGNCDSMRQVLASLPYYLIILIYTSKSVCFLS
jgi:hypothetical protein